MMIQTFCKLLSYQMRYGAMLRQARKAAGITQERLAELVTSAGLNIGTSMVSMIENEYDKTRSGEPTRVNKEFVMHAAAILNMNLDEALIVADYAPTNHLVLDIVRAIDGLRLTPDRERLAVRQIQALIQSLSEGHAEIEPVRGAHTVYVPRMELTDERKQKPIKKKAGGKR